MILKPLYFKLPRRALRNTDAQAHLRAVRAESLAEGASIQHVCFWQLRLQNTDAVPSSTQGNDGGQFTGELDHVDVAGWSGHDP